MDLTITEYSMQTCNRCGGKGRIAAYSHIKAGECFTCSGTGKVAGKPTTREMTDAEVLDALAVAGLPVMFVESTDGDDWLAGFFDTAKHAETMAAARALLAAV